MKAIFYVDGFNLYMARLKFNRQYRWLNIASLAEIIARKEASPISIEAVNFYTAYVSGKIDAAAVGKQQTYLAALRATPGIAVHPGNFVISDKWVKLMHPPTSKPDGYNWTPPYPEFVKAHIAQEKGSDVKLGVHLVRDAFEGKFDRAYVITSDTDLVEPVRIVTQEIGKEVFIVPPSRPQNTSKPIVAPSFAKIASGSATFTDEELAACQFPDVVLRPKQKSLTKPSNWMLAEKDGVETDVTLPTSPQHQNATAS